MLGPKRSSVSFAAKMRLVERNRRLIAVSVIDIALGCTFCGRRIDMVVAHSKRDKNKKRAVA